MKSGQNSSNNSAIKRIVPAVAMFALSAVMLSSSTYAWFTMNKEVEMTGLSMSAAAGSGMEIALASVNGTNITKPASRPDDSNEYSWNSSVVVGRYYSGIGKLKPASSVNGTAFFDAKNASNGGKTASEFKSVDTKAGATLRDELLGTGDTPSISSDGVDEGYYVDIPVYLRTNKKASATETSESIYCKMKIQNKKDGVDTEKDLSKAVRVIFIKSEDEKSSIFGINDAYYETGKAVKDANTKDTVTVNTDSKGILAGNTFPDDVGVDTGLTIPFATDSNTHGHLDFVVRVWLEGESTFCSDSTSGQNWNIDLAFAMGKFDDGTSTNQGTGTGEPSNP